MGTYNVTFVRLGNTLLLLISGGVGFNTVTEVSLEQPLKASTQILVTLLPMVADLRPEQL